MNIKYPEREIDIIANDVSLPDNLMRLIFNKFPLLEESNEIIKTLTYFKCSMVDKYKIFEDICTIRQEKKFNITKENIFQLVSLTVQDYLQTPLGDLKLTIQENREQFKFRHPKIDNDFSDTRFKQGKLYNPPNLPDIEPDKEKRLSYLAEKKKSLKMAMQKDERTNKGKNIKK